MQSTKYTIYAYIIIIVYYSIGFAKSASKFSGKLTKGGGWGFVNKAQNFNSCL